MQDTGAEATATPGDDVGAAPQREDFTLGGVTCAPGQRVSFELPIAKLMSGTPVYLPVVVVHGKKPGPVVWVSAAIHGDELIGVDVIRQVLADIESVPVAGTLIAVPIVNVHGFNTGERYLPDRRDLNRCFPGSVRGSLGARIAHLMMREIVERSEVGIDLHTGSAHRANLPQIRGNMDDERTLELARVFGAPVALHSSIRDGSLRQAATEAGATVLLYEAGEALRFDRASIETGVRGVRRVLDHLGMVEADNASAVVEATDMLVCRSSRWLRATQSGICHLDVDLGARVEQREPVGRILDPFGRRLGRITATQAGIVIGRTEHPLVNRGDAVLHVAEISEAEPEATAASDPVGL